MTDHLKETKYRIDCALDELEHFLTENPLQALWLYELPQWKRGDEGTLPDTIPVTEIHGGNELTPLLMKIYRQFYAPEPEGRDDEPSTKIVQRYPGIAVCSGSHEELTELIGQVNQAKDAFAAAIKAVGNPDQRFEAVHSRFPMMITLQATRYLKVLPCNTTRISFAWQKPIASKSDHDKLNRQLLLEKLTQERRYPPVNIAMQLDGDIWAAQIEEEIALVEALPENARLRYRRVLREVPQANWVYETFDAEQGEIIELRGNGKVNLPLLTTRMPDKLKGLKSYDRQKAEAKHRRPVAKGKILLPRLGIELIPQ